jgi:acetamidase/formamidase
MSDDRFKSIHHIHHGLGCLLSWNKDHKPLIHVDSGSEVTFDNFEAGFNNITRHTTGADLAKLEIQGLQDIEKLMGPIYVNGPVFINGAEPGDTLRVEILDLQTADWGWTCVLPGLGAFKDEFKEAHIKTYDLPPGQDYTVFKKGIHIPRQPFYGTIGVASADEGDFPPIVPRNDIGGNIDCRYVGQGSTLFLPVNVPGALFAVGDGHFAQGDGEICGTAIETMMKSRIRLTVLKGKPALKSPHYETAVQKVVEMNSVGGKGEHGVVATAEEQSIAAKQALEGLMDWLVMEKELTRVEAYMLISVAGSLKIMHEVGIPTHTVSASIPLGIFVGEG